MTQENHQQPPKRSKSITKHATPNKRGRAQLPVTESDEDFATDGEEQDDIVYVTEHDAAYNKTKRIMREAKQVFDPFNELPQYKVDEDEEDHDMPELVGLEEDDIIAEEPQQPKRGQPHTHVLMTPKTKSNKGAKDSQKKLPFQKVKRANSGEAKITVPPAHRFKTLEQAFTESRDGPLQESRQVLVFVLPEETDDLVTTTNSGKRKYRIVMYDHTGRKFVCTFWNGDAEKVCRTTIHVTVHTIVNPLIQLRRRAPLSKTVVLGTSSSSSSTASRTLAASASLGRSQP